MGYFGLTLYLVAGFLIGMLAVMLNEEENYSNFDLGMTVIFLTAFWAFAVPWLIVCGIGWCGRKLGGYLGRYRRKPFFRGGNC